MILHAFPFFLGFVAVTILLQLLRHALARAKPTLRQRLALGLAALIGAGLMGYSFVLAMMGATGHQYINEPLFNLGFWGGATILGLAIFLQLRA